MEKDGEISWIHRVQTGSGHFWRRNCLLKHVIEVNMKGKNMGRYDVEQDGSSYWMILSKRKTEDSSLLGP
jgi:hypothetical protein